MSSVGVGGPLSTVPMESVERSWHNRDKVIATSNESKLFDWIGAGTLLLHQDHDWTQRVDDDSGVEPWLSTEVHDIISTCRLNAKYKETPMTRFRSSFLSLLLSPLRFGRLNLSYQRYHIIRRLVNEYGLSWNGNDGRTPLQIICDHEPTVIEVKWWLSHGCPYQQINPTTTINNPNNDEDNSGRTLLHQLIPKSDFAYPAQEGVATLLINTGVDFGATYRHNTALDLCYQYASRTNQLLQRQYVERLAVEMKEAIEHWLSISATTLTQSLLNHDIIHIIHEYLIVMPPSDTADPGIGSMFNDD
jgi:hypothetical protein